MLWVVRQPAAKEYFQQAVSIAKPVVALHFFPFTD